MIITKVIIKSITIIKPSNTTTVITNHSKDIVIKTLVEINIIIEVRASQPIIRERGLTLSLLFIPLESITIKVINRLIHSPKVITHSRRIKWVIKYNKRKWHWTISSELKANPQVISIIVNNKSNSNNN